MTAIFHNAQVLGKYVKGQSSPSFLECLVVDDSTGKITHIGSLGDAEVSQAENAGAMKHDLGGRIVLPGFIDGHMHLLMMGQSCLKLSLRQCKSFQEIREAIQERARMEPDLDRILCAGWRQPTTDGQALASMLDDLDPRPIFIEADDLHSVWCNSAALAEMDVQGMSDPPGGHIHRDASGKATGLLSENAAHKIAWPHIAKCFSMEQNWLALRSAVYAYVSTGYTGVVEMAMDENGWKALDSLRSKEEFPLWVAAHWLITPKDTEAENIAQVDRAIELYRQFNAETSPDCRIAGIKIIGDGVVDACTAALQEPYSHENVNGDPMWTVETLTPVLRHANAAGLQCAVHAIGDLAVKIALDSFEKIAPLKLRPRMEHLETCSSDDAKRLGKLGVTASVQPVHSDPVLLRAWHKLLGPSRCGHTFAYSEFAKAGAPLALGSDAPTAPHAPLPNLYQATTRRSAREPECEERWNPQYALELSQAIATATEGSAYSCFADDRVGKLEKGYLANFVVVDMKWEPEMLLEAKVLQTWIKGKKVFDAA